MWFSRTLAAALIGASPAFAVITKIQNNGAASVTAAVTATLGASTTTGNLLVACAGNLADNTHPVSTMAGGGVTTWIKLRSSAVYANTELWYGTVTSGSATGITATFTGTSIAVEMFVTEFHSSIAGAWAVDQQNGNSSATSPLASGNITTTVATELISACANRNSNWLTTADSSFTSVSTTGDFMASAYRIVTSTGTYSTNWTFSGSNAEALIGSFYISTGGTTRMLMGVGK